MGANNPAGSIKWSYEALCLAWVLIVISKPGQSSTFANEQENPQTQNKNDNIWWYTFNEKLKALLKKDSFCTVCYKSSRSIDTMVYYK